MVLLRRLIFPDKFYNMELVSYYIRGCIIASCMLLQIDTCQLQGEHLAWKANKTTASKPEKKKTRQAKNNCKTVLGRANDGVFDLLNRLSASQPSKHRASSDSVWQPELPHPTTTCPCPIPQQSFSVDCLYSSRIECKWHLGIMLKT